ncbi:hypothetical protein MLD38_017375 [Melastoma candidum]|uniref:Uncharacterized protein n=1 Tax=Melastoma candidum TaxID=119954 RepID=A0ACB9QRR7_9MYRT|nr:hypothetical protein MLD38_017375 [Melastoma candidum]
MNFLKRLFPTRSGLPPFRSFPHAFSSYYHSSADTLVEVHSQEQEVVIALGGNVGDRVGNINEALDLMRKRGLRITRHSCLYETAPAYVTDQPHFLNAAVRAFTSLGPHELLKQLKQIEKDLGRTAGVRYGPRPIDLDILFYGRFRVRSDVLNIPHERIWERPFVLAPLVDLIGSTIDSDTVACWHSFALDADGLLGSWRKLGGESSIGKEGLRRVLPIAGSLWDWSERTSVMGILNLTPDSFSDGGMFQSREAATAQVRLMISEGADIIDLGAQSTRPMAQRLSAQEELGRLIPVLEAILGLPEMEDKLVSVDTFHSEVALEAVRKGAHLINDVSAGSLDDKMFAVIADLEVPYVSMHMRGDPCTMQSEKNLEYGDICEDIAEELSSRVKKAELSGIPAWRMIIDPGIGFSKTTEQNMDILVGLPNFREQLAKTSLAMSHAPILIGPSRKRFLGEICARSVAVDRDAATVASVTAGILAGANIVRVHNVKPNLDAAKVCDAMIKSKKRRN